MVHLVTQTHTHMWHTIITHTHTDLHNPHLAASVSTLHLSAQTAPTGKPCTPPPFLRQSSCQSNRTQRREASSGVLWLHSVCGWGVRQVAPGYVLTWSSPTCAPRAAQATPSASPAAPSSIAPHGPAVQPRLTKHSSADITPQHRVQHSTAQHSTAQSSAHMPSSATQCSTQPEIPPTQPNPAQANEEIALECWQVVQMYPIHPSRQQASLGVTNRLQCENGSP